MPAIPDDRLLAELSAILRDMPPRAEILHEEEVNEAWLGRAGAAISLWDSHKAPLWDLHLSHMRAHAAGAHARTASFSKMVSMLHQARFDLQHRLGGPVGMYTAQGRVYDYFDQVRQVIEMANIDLMFVDRYLEGDFVARYLPFVPAGVNVRLLAREGVPKLKPAVEAFVLQNPQAKIAIRSSQNIHERFVFVDDRLCYQSGDSFKDGAKAQGVLLAQLTDAFAPVRDTYEALWAVANVERP